MAEERGFLVGQSLREKLKSTIAKVDSLALGGPVSRIPTVIEGVPSAPGNPLKFAAFTGTAAWVVGTQRQIYMMQTAENTATNPEGVMSTASTAVAFSCLFSIPGNTSTAAVCTSLVAITKLNGNWQVIASVAN